jgi:hypothetical protein
MKVLTNMNQEHIKAVMKMESDQEKVNLSLMMAVIIKEDGKMIKFLDMVDL